MPDQLVYWYGYAGLAGVAAASFVIALSGALMPGPLLVAAVREGARQGDRAGPLLTLGHGILEAGVVALACLGLVGFLKRPGPFAVVAGVGGLMLLAMGLMMIGGARKARAADLLAARGKKAERDRRLAAGWVVLAGAVVSLSNPYWILWWLGIGLACITLMAEVGWPALAAFFLGHISADLAWYWLVTYAVSRGRRLLTDRSYRALIVFCGMFLIGFAGWLFYKGAERLELFGPSPNRAEKPLQAGRSRISMSATTGPAAHQLREEPACLRRESSSRRCSAPDRSSAGWRA